MATKHTLKVLQPAYYDKFSCIGNACELDCCKDWGIYVDKNTYLRYRRMEDEEFQQELPNRMRRLRGEKANAGNYAQFVLREDGSCPFQQEDGLCEIHRKFGHQALCNTCQIYPRVGGMVFEDVREMSLVMSCPEAVRIALFNPEPMSFQMADKELDTSDVMLRTYYRQPSPKGKGAKVLPHAWIIRESCIDILQSRSTPLADRILVVGMLLSKVTELGEAEKADEIPAALAAYVEAAKTGEFAGALGQMADNETIRAAVSAILMRNMLAHTVTGKRADLPFREFLGQYLKTKGGEMTVELNKPETYLDMHAYARERVGLHWAGFLEQRGYILENYFVNYVFSSVFPFYFQEFLSPYHHGLILAEQYAVIRMLLCGGASDEEGITDAQIIRVLASMSQNAQHNDEAKRITETYQKAESDSLAHISFLLRD